MTVLIVFMVLQSVVFTVSFIITFFFLEDPTPKTLKHKNNIRLKPWVNCFLRFLKIVINVTIMYALILGEKASKSFVKTFVLNENNEKNNEN